jgi:CHAT domain-containing protein
VFASPLHPSASTLAVRAATFVLALFPLASLAAPCDPVLANHPAAIESTLEVRGGERVKRSFRIPAGGTVLVIAREQNIDVTLEIIDSAQQRVAIGDNPIRRTGIQRATFATRGENDYSAEVIGKERSYVRGSVELRVITFQRDSDSSCFELHRTLASADSDYAVGQSVTAGASISPQANGPKAYESAANGYRSVLARLEKEEPSALLAEVQHALAALMYQDIKGRAEANVDAAALAERAEQTYRAVDNPYGRARAQALQAAALIEIAVSPTASAGVDASQRAHEMLNRARAQLDAVAAFHARRGEAYDQAHALNDIGIAYFQEVLNEEAIAAYKRALTVYERIGDSLWRARVLQNIAVAEYELGRASSAVARYTEVLSLISPKDWAWSYLVVLNNSAAANWANGGVDSALSQYSDALDLARTLQSVSEEARSLHGIGSVYDSIGDRDLALNFYRQALALRPATSDGRARAASLRAIANILSEQGNAEEALKMHREALQLASAPSNAARIRVQLAMDMEKLGQREGALQELDAVVQHRATGDDLARAHALIERSRLRMSVANAAAVAADLRSALKTFREFELPAEQFAAWIELARLERLQGATDKALSAVDNALALAEEVRLQSANPELRATLMQPLRPAFDLKISMLADRYFNAGSKPDQTKGESLAMQALMTAEQARARALSDFQSLDASGARVTPERAQRRRTLYKELAARRAQLETRLDRSGPADARVVSLRRDIATLRQQLDRANAEIATASSVDSRPVGGGAERKSIDLRAIPTDTAVIEYWLGANDTVAWVLTRERMAMVRLGRTSTLNDAARAFHESLRGFGSVPVAERLKRGERLHDLIIRPVAALIAEKRELIIAPDGALHYVPFAALRSAANEGSRFLIEAHDVAVTASIGMLLSDRSSARMSQATKQMLLVDDPIYDADDPRLSTGKPPTPASKPSIWSLALLRSGEQRGSLPRLPATAREAAAIAALVPKGEVDQLEGFAATKERFLHADLGRYRFIHIASHAVADAEIPQLSALILSTLDREGRALDSRVLAADFLNTRLDADAVVLSACDTALGKDVAGEGLVGLRYVVLARGARSVISSLWQVPDYAAAQIMTRFYTALLRRNLPVIAASSAAMRETIAREFKDPALWAAFAVTVARMSSGVEVTQLSR